jgi:hypothetical protein
MLTPHINLPEAEESPKGRDIVTAEGGSLLNAKTAPHGVTIAREFTPRREPSST